MNKLPALRRSYIVAGLLACVLPARGGTISVRVQDDAGGPVKDAVVYATPASGLAPDWAKKAVVSQRNKEFVPHVTVVQVGTAVQFPNLDPEKHHIYSISPAKRFELPLYSGTPANPIVFDKTGLVTLGCNIHDWMLGYIFVVNTPWFGVTGADGQVQLKDVPSGSYDVEVWQPRLKKSSATTRQQVALGGEKSSDVVFRIALRPEFRLARKPADAREIYH